MAKLFGCLLNEAQRVPDALYPYREVLRVSEAESPFGWGIAHQFHGDVLAKLRPRHVGGIDFFSKVRDIRAQALVGDVRRLDMGRTVPENTQPFRFRHWICAHRGAIARFEQVRPWLLSSIPNFLRRNIKGVTDSELLFHLLLAFLYDDGLLDVVEPPTELLARAMRNTFRTVERFVGDAGGGESELNLLITNGRVMGLSAHSAPAYYTTLHGITDCALCRQPPDAYSDEPRRVDHENVKLALLLTDPPEDQDISAFTRVDPRTILLADQSYTVHSLPLVD